LCLFVHARACLLICYWLTARPGAGCSGVCVMFVYVCVCACVRVWGGWGKGKGSASVYIDGEEVKDLCYQAQWMRGGVPCIGTHTHRNTYRHSHTRKHIHNTRTDGHTSVERAGHGLPQMPRAHTHTHTHTYTHTHTHTYTHAHTITHTHEKTHENTHIHTLTYVQMANIQQNRQAMGAPQLPQQRQPFVPPTQGPGARPPGRGVCVGGGCCVGVGVFVRILKCHPPKVLSPDHQLWVWVWVWVLVSL